MNRTIGSISLYALFLWGTAIDQVVPRSSPLRRAAFLEYSGNDLRDHRLVRYSLRGALSAGIV